MQCLAGPRSEAGDATGDSIPDPPRRGDAGLLRGRVPGVHSARGPNGHQGRAAPPVPVGGRGANLCIALFFTFVHAPVQYVPNIVPFLVVLFTLAWTWGFIIQRTEALWGAVLFHAGADLIIILGIFKAYGAV